MHSALGPFWSFCVSSEILDVGDWVIFDNPDWTRPEPPTADNSIDQRSSLMHSMDLVGMLLHSAGCNSDPCTFSKAFHSQDSDRALDCSPARVDIGSTSTKDRHLEHGPSRLGFWQGIWNPWSGVRRAPDRLSEFVLHSGSIDLSRRDTTCVWPKLLSVDVFSAVKE